MNDVALLTGTRLDCSLSGVKLESVGATFATNGGYDMDEDQEERVESSKRIQVRLSDKAAELFQEITEKLDVPDKEAFLDALGLLHFAVVELEEGRQIGSYDPLSKHFTGFTTTALRAYKQRLSRNRDASKAVSVQRAAAATGR